jgi:hypothetical protein
MIEEDQGSLRGGPNRKDKLFLLGYYEGIGEQLIPNQIRAQG